MSDLTLLASLRPEARELKGDCHFFFFFLRQGRLLSCLCSPAPGGWVGLGDTGEWRWWVGQLPVGPSLVTGEQGQQES
jgi:hypothetical protein